MVLDATVDSLQQRVANCVYDSARNGSLGINNFPAFGPVVAALKENPEHQPGSFKVCVQKHDKLAILQSLVAPWLDAENLKDEANGLIKDHNERFNVEGDWLENDTARRGLWNL